MTEQDEEIYLRGERSAWWQQLHTVLRELGYDKKDFSADERHKFSRAQLALERENGIRALRSICDDFGDNDWPDNLTLIDIISKHLENHLHERMLERGS